MNCFGMMASVSTLARSSAATKPSCTVNFSMILISTQSFNDQPTRVAIAVSSFVLHPGQLIRERHQRTVARRPYHGILDDVGSLGTRIFTAHFRIFVACNRNIEEQSPHAGVRIVTPNDFPLATFDNLHSVIR